MLSTIILDGYTAFLFIKMGDATSLFDKFSVATEYHIFERLSLGVYLMVANMILLGFGVGILVKTFLKK